MTTLTASSPQLPGYGMAIYNSSGNLLTGFSANETVLREVWRSTFSGSTASTLLVGTGVPSGITSSNTLPVTTYTSGGGWAQTNSGYISGTSVYVSPISGTSATRTGVVSLCQFKDATPGAGAYGLQIINGNSDIVLDEGSYVWSVHAEGTLPNTSGWQQYGTDDPNDPGETNFDEYAEAYPLTLPTNTYAVGKPFIVAVRCTTDHYIIQPYVAAGASGYYTQVIFHRPRIDIYDAEFPLSYQYKILVSPFDFVPVKDGSTYGMEIYSSVGGLQWSSRWRQGIIQKTIDLNSFSAGTTQNGTYDYETGSDGVTAPIQPDDNGDPYTKALHCSTGQAVAVSWSIDPLNAYVGFWGGSGKVEYHQSRTSTGYGGGGQHWPAVRILDGGTTGYIKMHRTARGTENISAPGTRRTGSFHPTGKIAIFRIL